MSATLACATSAHASLDALEEQLASLNAGEDTANELIDTTERLEAAFAFVEVLEHNVEAAAALVEATGRRLEALERCERLPAELEQLSPAMFSAHQFVRQVKRRERPAPPELPELSVLPPCRPIVRQPSSSARAVASIDDLVSGAAEVEKAARERASQALAAATPYATRAATGARNMLSMLQERAAAAGAGFGRGAGGGASGGAG